MMEKSHSRERHRNTVFVTAFDHGVVADRSARLGYIFNAASVRAFDIVEEREERVGAERNAVDRIEISAHLFGCERFGTACEITLPYAVGAYVFFVFVYISVYDVISVRSSYIVPERK